MSTTTKHPEGRAIPPRPLPGDRPVADEIARMVRVDHAGEYGAARIYAGQLDVLGPDHPLSETIRHMAEQEERHLETFDAMLLERGVRPTLLSPAWHVAGYALGAVTALMGEKALMACTAAVEEVIDDHYAEQEDYLEKHDPDLKAVVSDFRADEAEHRETAIEHGAEETPGYGLLSRAIKFGCRAAIAVSKRV